MKSSNTKALTTRLIVALALAAVSVAGLSGLAEAATCYTCHAPVGSTTDLRPVESSPFRNITTGSIKGSHLKHIPVATILVSDCAACHGGAGGVTAYTTKHRNGILDVPIVGYSRAGFAQTGNPVLLGTCSTASCHVTSHGTTYVPTPTWGVTSGCVGCHTGAGAFTGTGQSPDTGSHTKHLAASATCGQCHAGAVASSNGGNAHVDGNIDVTAGYLVTNVVKHTAGSGYSTCSTAGGAACHVSPFGTGTIPTTVWGTADCAACHVNGGASLPTTGSHTKHTATGAVCGSCHANATAGVTGGSAHRDGNIDVTNVGYTPNVTKHTAGSGYKTCISASCHASPYGTTASTTPTWGAGGAGGCVSCHNGAGALTASGGPSTGSHTKHFAQSATCGQCHAGAVSAISAGSTGGNFHPDTNIDVTGTSVSGYTANVTKHSSASGYTGSCSTSCHTSPYTTAAGTSPTWGAAGGCGSCHNGEGAFVAGGPVTGSHTKHQASPCGNCHAGAVSAATAGSSGGTAHRDTNIDVTGTLVGSSYTANVTKHAVNTGYVGTCSTTCHGNPYNTTPGSTPSWGSAGSGCGACHNGVGAFTAAGSSPNSGSHSKHMTLTVNSVLTTCATCHTGADASTTGGIYHGDNNIDVIGYTPNITKHAINTSYKTCTTANCHVNPFGTASIPSPTWGQSSTCGECHTGAGSFSGAGTSPTTGSHTKHQANGASCTQCHAGASAGISGGTAHIDANIDVTNVGYTPDVTKHSSGSGYYKCTNASCHTSPYTTLPATTPSWGSVGAGGCVSCHNAIGAFTAGGGPATGSHTKHLALTCGQCHAGASGSTGGNFHRDANIDVTGTSVSNYTADVTKHAANSGYVGTCSTSCHANPYTTVAGSSPTWGFPGSGGCGSCHNGAGAFVSGGPTTGSHTKHQAALCASCHAGASAGVTGGTAHGDTNIDVTGTLVGSSYTANVTKHAANTGYAGTCSTSCHGNPYNAVAGSTPTWGSAGSGCGACHNGVGAFTGTGTAPATGSHTKHMAVTVNSVLTTCATCHTGADPSTTGGIYHGDNNIDIIGYRTPNVTKHDQGGGYDTCTTANCHVSPFGTASIPSPTWGQSSACGECHTGAGSFSGSGTSPTTGSHTKHQASGTSGRCTNCHTGASAGISGGIAHLDGNIDITVGYAVTNVTKHTTGSGFSTCSINNASCHTNPFGTAMSITPTWGAPSLACSACHNGTGAFGGAGTSPTTGSHSKHQAGGSQCGSCHVGATAGVTGGAASHGDGNIDVVAGYITPNYTKHAPGGYTLCSSTTCHGNPYATGAALSPTWGTVFATCAACHNGVGAFTGAGLSPATGSHAAHSGKLCNQCHTGASAGVTGGPTATHMDGNIDVIASYTANVTKHAPGSGYKTCTNTPGCHGTVTVTWGTTLGCIGCHAGVIARTVGPAAGKTLAAVSGEFGLAYGHKASGKTPVRTAVNDDDCIVCHLEGIMATGVTSPTYHKDGNISLRDPDGLGETPITNIAGGAWTFRRFSTSFAAASRTTSVTETIPNIISQKFCLRCHDANGATNTTARTSARTVAGTAAMPFGGVALGANYTATNGAIGTQGLINVAGQFATTNTSRHPVLAPKNKDFPTQARMIAPFNNFTRVGTSGTMTLGVVMNCFDCHNTTAASPSTLRTVSSHGNTVSLRGVASGASPTLCLKCHSGYTPSATAGHAAGSAFTSPEGRMEAEQDTCAYCHASKGLAVARPIVAQDTHGSNTLPTAGTKTGRWLATGIPVSFMRNTVNMTDHSPKKVGATTYAPICSMIAGEACGARPNSPYTPGGTY